MRRSDVDSECDGMPDCHDGCPMIDKTAPTVRLWKPDTDTDGDGTADCNDTSQRFQQDRPGVCGCGVPG
jgi:hypothetical protein